MASEIYIGLMSGTSMDGIDAAAVEFSGRRVTLHGTLHSAYPDSLRDSLQTLAQTGGPVRLGEYGALHAAVAHAFAEAVHVLLNTAGLSPDRITAIGSHGQTVGHQPHGQRPFSLQLGDPGTLAVRTGIPVVADFRNADIALGGQGAPLAPGFHAWAFGSQMRPGAVVNIGGIANVTLIDRDGHIRGFDSGPGNTLLDAWCRQQRGEACDRDGAWAAAGTVHDALLRRLLADPYFGRTPPKSTGTGYFNLAWLARHVEAIDAPPGPQDVQATLAELTAASVAEALQGAGPPARAAVCGGGVHNADLMARLRRHLPDLPVMPTDDWGIPADWVEAIAFAWLARQRLAGEPGNVPAVTGATAPVPLGGVFLPAVRVTGS